MTLVNIARGARNYLRAPDIIAAAPLHSRPESFRFAFRQVAHNPGAWRLADELDADRETSRVAVTLKLKFSSHLERWAFVTNPTTSMESHADVDESGMIRGPRLTGGRFTCELTDAFPLWDQIVAAVRDGGERIYPGTAWYIVQLEGGSELLRNDYPGRELSIMVANEHRRLVALDLALDGRPAGRVGVSPRTITDGKG